ncbi:MAG: FecR domain-containing protein [Sphingobacteriaceae bacterium]|nr:FecR domain-containing protein [Sphingobacteriaceae bacterium]
MDPQEIDLLLARHFSGETQPDDEIKLQEWKDRYPDEYASLKSMIDSYSDAAPDTDSDIDSAWKEVDMQIKMKDLTTGATKTKPLFFLFQRVAAVLFLICSISLVYLIFFYDPLIVESSATNASKTVMLSDGSQVTLNAGSRIEYHKRAYLKSRCVRLLGEAFFQVKPDEGNPFTVFGTLGQIRVLGTSFNVAENTDSMEVVVKTGKVLVTMLGEEKKAVSLVAGKRAVIAAGKLIQNDVFSENGIAWKTGVLIFKNEPLGNVFNILEKTYHKKIIYSSNQATCRLTTIFKNQSLESVLLEINEVFPMDYITDSSSVKINRIDCGKKL